MSRLNPNSSAPSVPASPPRLNVSSNGSGGGDYFRDLFAYFRQDFLASIVVFLVALPLCIGIAVAVGVSPARALITGIIGGLVVGFMAGSPLQVSGPAAGLFVIVADLLMQGRTLYQSKLGGDADPSTSEGQAVAYSLVVLGCAVFLAGLLQIVAGRLRIGQWFRAVSPAVIKGMLAGIGVLILFSQIHVMLDHTAMWGEEKAHGGLQYCATIPEAIGKCFSADTSNNHHLAAITGLLTIAILVLWPSLSPKRLKSIPSALVAIVVATLFALIAGLDIQRIDVPRNMFDEVTFPSAVWLGLLFEPVVLGGAFVIAIVASAETLLCATAVDRMHSGPKTKYDQELIAQGIGNSLCGLLGALPMTGVIVRSTANVSSGAKTRLSAILHGLWLLLFVAALPFLLSYIPRAALGALLVYTGYKLVNLREIKNLWSTSKSEAGIFFATLIVIVVEDLLIGVVVGVVLSAIKLLHRFSRLEMRLEVQPDQRVAHLRMEGAATFLRLPALAAQLEQVPGSAELHVGFEHLTYIDHACLDLLIDWARQHETNGGRLVLDWEQLHGRFTSDPKSGTAPRARSAVAETAPSPNAVKSLAG